MTIEEILAKLAKKEAITEDERSQLTEALKGAVSGQKVDGKSLTADEQAVLLKSADALKGTPEMQSLFKEIAQDKNADRFSKRYKPFFNLLLSGADVATSLQQIRASKQALKNLVRPTLPGTPGLDPVLNNEIYKAQQGNFDAARAIAPAQQELRDQYSRDLGTARQVSNGNAATYGSLAQQASLSRARAGAALPAVSDQIRRQQQARLDNLIGMRQGAVQQQFGNNMQKSGILLDQYNRDAQAAGQLGATGRLNLRNSLQGLGDNVIGVAGRMMPVSSPYGNAQGVYQPTVSNSEPFADYRAEVDQSLADKLQRIQSNNYFNRRA